uniref:Uncharacterized protein n=1 Tax=Meloidogyne enterolobii TaxID=390850 RepID=A0A6V7XGW9_MELEN|nr:unnamed protein product [Meloidogyne enterolobii]
MVTLLQKINTELAALINYSHNSFFWNITFGQLQKLVHQNYLELIKYIGIVDSEIFKEINEWNLDKFPISGIDLMSLNIPKGPKMKKVLKYLFNVWIKNNLKLNREELLEHIKDNEVDNILAEIEEPTNKKKRRMPGPFSLEKR